MARRLGAPVSGFTTRAPKGSPNVTPPKGSVSPLGQAASTGPGASGGGSHGIRVQGSERATKSSGKGSK